MVPFQLFLVSCFSLTLGLDYYELLGVERTSNNHEIRRAFKKLAVTLHPDKNKDDPDSHKKFVKLTRAYEVLKDDEKRKYYDIHGEDSDDSSKQKYHSYTYYRDQFGIYDEDPQIITLSQSDFETNVEGSEKQWFINFYSPLCSHCHELAPIWRSISKELQGALMFGAVNCEEDWNLCNEQGIQMYPTLIMYPLRERFKEGMKKITITEFIFNNVETDLVMIKSQKIWDERRDDYPSWLLSLSNPNPLDKESRIAVAAMLKGLLGVAYVDCMYVSCDEFVEKETSTSIIYLEKKHDIWLSTPVNSDDPQEIMKAVLDLIPSVTELNEQKFRELIEKLNEKSSKPWLIYFHIGGASDVDLEVKKLKAMLPKFSLGSLNCGRYSIICTELSISRYPIFGIFKEGGGRELHHGPSLASSIASFARESALATNLRTLNEPEFDFLVNDNGAWFVDFYAPWCPPCMRLLPQLRKASSFFQPGTVRFATVDCTVEIDLCHEQNIRSYPTTLLFNSTQNPLRFRGSQTASSIIEFIQDIINPVVLSLTEETFYTTVGRKSPDSIWIVDYFMPWCGPCQQLAPQMRKLAKMISDIPFVHIAEVNCEVETSLCSQQGVTSYPNIRLYPLNSHGLNTVALYNGFQRDAHSLRRWLFNFMDSPVVQLDPSQFKRALESKDHWLIDFYTPWCGHCVAFEPDFITVAQKLEKKISTGKVNCEEHPQLCRKEGIRAYPTVMFYQNENGTPKGVPIDSQNPITIIKFVNEMLASSPTHDEL